MRVKIPGARALLVAALALIAAATGAACAPPSPGPGHVVISYGPFTVPAAANGQMGMLSNQLLFNAKKPCTYCYVTGMVANLVNPDGSTANVNEGMWLHHMVMTNSARPDATCSFGGFGGDRFFASGNERTPVNLSASGMYGYPVNTTDQWTLLYDLMNMGPTAKTVSITVAYDYVPISTPGMQAARSLWLDVAQCRGSEVPAKTGQYSYSYTWTSNLTGKMIHAHGHAHDGATHMTVTKNGSLVCDSVFKYGETPGYVEVDSTSMPGMDMPGMTHISSASACTGTSANPITTLALGDQVRIEVFYDSNLHPQMGDEPVMGIVHAWVAPF